MKSTEETIAKFRQNRLKITPQRRVILELLVDDSSHPSANQIYRRATKVMPDISRTTVYNTINDLIKLNEISEVSEMGKDGLRYDVNTETHHHLFCVECNTLVDINRDFDHLDLTEEEESGFEIFKHQVTFYGRCPVCAQQN